MRTPHCLVALLAVLLITGPAQARTTYDVEIIVFENVDVPADPGERWRPQVRLPRFERATTFDNDPPTAGAFLHERPAEVIELTEDELRLIDRRRQLERSARYRVLRHIGWQQPGFAPEDAIALRIRAGEPITVDLPIRDPGSLGGPLTLDEILLQGPRPVSTEPTITESDTLDLQPSRLQPRTRTLEVYPLDGTIQITVRRYLHIHTDLHFTVPIDWADSPAELLRTEVGEGLTDDTGDDGANGGRDDSTAIAGTALARDIATDSEGRPMLSYPIRQHRRMRSRELHYLDHPVIGVLVLVTPRSD